MASGAANFRPGDFINDVFGNLVNLPMLIPGLLKGSLNFIWDKAGLIVLAGGILTSIMSGIGSEMKTSSAAGIVKNVLQSLNFGNLALGSIISGLAGFKAGALLGSAFGPIGALIGGIIGAIMGVIFVEVDDIWGTIKKQIRGIGQTLLNQIDYFATAEKLENDVEKLSGSVDQYNKQLSLVLTKYREAIEEGTADSIRQADHYEQQIVRLTAFRNRQIKRSIDKIETIYNREIRIARQADNFFENVIGEFKEFSDVLFGTRFTFNKDKLEEEVENLQNAITVTEKNLNDINQKISGVQQRLEEARRGNDEILINSLEFQLREMENLRDSLERRKDSFLDDLEDKKRKLGINLESYFERFVAILGDSQVIANSLADFVLDKKKEFDDVVSDIRKDIETKFKDLLNSIKKFFDSFNPFEWVDSVFRKNTKNEIEKDVKAKQSSFFEESIINKNNENTTNVINSDNMLPASTPIMRTMTIERVTDRNRKIEEEKRLKEMQSVANLVNQKLTTVNMSSSRNTVGIGIKPKDRNNGLMQSYG